MQKSFIIDGSYGEITNKLEDKIQSGQGLSLRERSFELLENFIPSQEYLAQTINGVKLEYLINNEQSKTFPVRIDGLDAILHIFSDKIITSFPSKGKIFVDILPEDINLIPNSVSTCFKITQNKKSIIVFNSITGVYFATTLQAVFSNIDNGNPYFEKIEIPKDLKQASITSGSDNVYLYGEEDIINQDIFVLVAYFILTPIGTFFGYKITGEESNIKKLYYSEKTQFYIESSKKLLNSIIEFNFIWSVEKDYAFPVKCRINKTTKGLKFTTNGLTKIYPYEQARYPNLPNWKIPNDAVLIDLFVCDLDINDFIYQALQTMSNSILEHIRNYRNATQKHFIEGSMEISDIEKYRAYSVCYTNLKTNIKIISENEQSQSATFNPYTPYSLNGRLVVSSKNNIKFSKVGDFANFNFTEDKNPTEASAFERTLSNVDEITFINQWGQVGQQGFVIGTPEKLFYFSAVGNIFNQAILGSRNIPCSYIQPVQLKFVGYEALLIVEAGRKKITGVIFSRDETREINLTDAIDFFDTDPIQKIQSIRYGKDKMIFVLTDSKKLYACLTGNDRLAWFKISLNYFISDIATIEESNNLYIVSSLNNNSNYNLVGSIDFSEGAENIRAEYYPDVVGNKDITFSDDIPLINGTTNYLQKFNLSNEVRTKLAKPLVCKTRLHNQEVINSKVNTKAQMVKRKISNVSLNVRNSNFFKIDYVMKNNNRNEWVQNVYNVDKLDNSLNPAELKELIKVRTASPFAENVKISIETLPNSIIPLTIQSLSFDTEYGNIK